MTTERRISLVDDLDENRHVMTRLLGRFFQTTSHADGPTALRELVKCPPDLILLDISMPGMDGLEVLGKLKENPRFGSTVVVAFSALATPDRVAEYRAAGFDDCICKPVLDIEGMVRRLSRLIDERDARYRAAACS